MRTILMLSGAVLMALALPGTPTPAVPLLPHASRPTPPIPEAPAGGGSAPAAFAQAYRDAAAAMRAAGAPYAAWAVAGRRFLAFDATGDGTAAEVIGDLSAATQVAVLVPGVDARLRDFDRGLGGVPRRAPAVQARAVYAGLRAADPAARVAVVAWLGYDAPDGLGLDAARDTAARTGATALTGFVRDLQARRPGIAVTLIGHSYGAVVVGLAAPRLPGVPDVVALGAPGMGADRAADLGGARVWSALAAADWIRRVPQVRLLRLGHGRRPSAPAFGARPLPTAGVAGHDYYLTPGSATLDAVAAVVLGRATAVEAAA
jgi:Alpha/beta hydrolase